MGFFRFKSLILISIFLPENIQIYVILSQSTIKNNMKYLHHIRQIYHSGILSANYAKYVSVKR